LPRKSSPRGASQEARYSGPGRSTTTGPGSPLLRRSATRTSSLRSNGSAPASGAADTRITWAGRSVCVRAETVTTTTTASHATGIRLVLARSRDDNNQGLHAFSYTENGVTHGPDDLTALALRRAIFRDEPARASLFGMVDLGDPLGRIPTGLPADSYKAVAGLVVTDALADTGRADRVTVRVAPPGPGGRLAVVEWTGRGTPGGRVEGTIPT